MASAGANRLSREDRLTATTSKYETPTTAPANQSSLSPLTPEEIADRLVPSDPRISPDGSRVIFACRRRARPARNGHVRSGSLAMIYRLVSSRLARPMIAMPAGRLMARECSSARIASNQEATNIGCSCYPFPVGKPCL